MDAIDADVPTSSCPNCGTPRGPYDRFCTGCAADLGAPGAPIGLIGTLGEMNVAGPSSRQAARAQPASTARSVVGWVVPGSRSRPLSPGAPVSAMARGGQLSGIGGYPDAVSSIVARRLWRTLAIAGRLSAAIGVFFTLAGLVAILDAPLTRDALIGWILLLVLFVLLPTLLLWFTAERVVSGQPPWIRSLAVIEMMVVIFVSVGLAIVPLVLIFWVIGEEPS